MAESAIAEHIQGQEDEGQQPNGYPVRISGKDTVTGVSRTPGVTPAGELLVLPSAGGSVVVTDIEDGTGGSIMDAPANAAQVSIVKTIPIPVTQSTSPWITQENNETASGTLAGNGQSVVLANHGKGCAQLDIVGATLNCTLTVEYSQDGGTTWYPLEGVNQTTLGLLATSAFGSLGNLPFNALYSIAGLDQIRVIASAYVGGTAVAIWTAGDGTISPNPVGRGLFFNSGFGAHSPVDAAANANETICSAANIGIFQWGMPHNFNNTTWDRARNNTQKTLLASAGRAASTNSPDQTNYNSRGVTVFFNISALAAGQTLTVTIAVKDAVSAAYVAVLTTAAIAAAGMTRLTVYPGGPLVAGLRANDVISRTWRVQVVLGGAAGTSTYSVTATEQL